MSTVSTKTPSPAERAQHYLQNAENMRSKAAKTMDEGIRESLERLAADWEFLARYTESTGKLR